MMAPQITGSPSSLMENTRSYILCLLGRGTAPGFRLKTVSFQEIATQLAYWLPPTI